MTLADREVKLAVGVANVRPRTPFLCDTYLRSIASASKYAAPLEVRTHSGAVDPVAP